MAKKKISNQTFMLILFPIMAIVVAAVVFGNIMASTWSSIISKFFNHDTYKIVTVEGETVDAEYYKNDFKTEEELNAHNAEVSERIEAEGMVLLKNEESALPLKSGAKISCFSVSSVDMVYGGTGSGSIDTSTAPTLKDALEKSGFSVNETLWDFYKDKNANGHKRSSPNWRGGQFSIKEVPWGEVSVAAASSFSEYSDAAIVVISRSGGEGSDLTAQNFGETENVAGNKGSYLELSSEEKEMLDAVNELFDRVIVLVNANNALELGWLNEYENVKAALWVGGVGQTGMYAIAKALKGEVVPSGRLVDTYAYDADSAPAAQNAGANFWIENKPASAGYANEADQYAVYQEGIYVGYRYYETRYEDKVLGRANTGDYDYASTVLYPFGYGLSYTEFEYSNFSVTEIGDSFEVSVTVKNVGDYDGKDVVEIYGQSPYTDYDVKNGVEKSAIELMGFAKTGVIKQGQSETVTVSVDKREFVSYDYKGAETYVLDAGDYYLAFGTSAHDALNNILAAKGKTVSDGMTSEGDSSFVYKWNNRSFDSVTYSTDSKTGVKITNQFEKADLTYYDDGANFKYLTRNDWTGTFPKAFADRVDEKGEKYKTFSQKLIDDLAPAYVEDKASYTMPETATTTGEGLNLATLIGEDYDSQAWNDFLDKLTPESMLTTVRMGGYGNPANPALNVPATTAKDGPAGISATLIGGTKGMAYPTEVVIASTWNVDLAKELGEAVGNDAMFANVQAWYAPAMNTHRTAYAGRNFEYYSEDGFLAGKIGAATVAGAQSKGLICYVKHFALNDGEGVIDATNGIKGSKDGIATFANEQAIREIYLKPFEYAVKEGGCTGIMNAFNRIGTTWCGHHGNLQKNVLRGEWGFKGCIITDNAGLPDYMEIKAGLQAGTDLWMNNNDTRYRIDGYESDPQIMTYLRESAHHVLYAIADSVAMNGLSSNTKIVHILPTWWYWVITLDVVVGALVVAGVVWTVIRVRKNKEV
ncbi:MAG: glycoside hydrolase family 3 protein [Clostridia bacterium]|nr:glycoside hydrolase family 3 protein [Clostridia bacterium]